MNVSDFDFDLPPELIAQVPAEPRGSARLMVLDRRMGRTEEVRVGDLHRWLKDGDVLVLNDTRVFPARLLGHRVPSGGAVECLLLGRLDAERWDALVHPGQKLRPGEQFVCEGASGRLVGLVEARHTFGRRTVRLVADAGADIDAVIDAIGHVPLPPYIKRPDVPADRQRYQTVFARRRGSVAAPTAGLHLTQALLDALTQAGVERVDVTLHVGYGTFKPVRGDSVEGHRVDPEEYEVSAEAADRINHALDEGRRIVAVGTTVTRTLESAALVGGGRVAAGRATSGLFIYPGFAFQVVGALLTNFHVPRSSLLMLACAFGGREHVLNAYAEAMARHFRFYSYGDAMLIV
jgi:S-adenosylmethionine:tRNA ribosyltransferase-isomerase